MLSPRIRSGLFLILSVFRALVSGLFGRLAFMVLGAVIASVVILGRESEPKATTPPRGDASTYRDDDGAVHIRLALTEQEYCSNLVVHADNGEETARLQVFRNGSYSFEPAAKDQRRFILHRYPDGRIFASVQSGNAQPVLSSLPDGSAEMLVGHDHGKQISGLHVNVDGDVMPHEEVRTP